MNLKFLLFRVSMQGCNFVPKNPERKLNNDIVPLVFVHVRRNSTCLHTDDKENVIRLLTAICLTSSQTKTRYEYIRKISANLRKSSESPVLLTDVLSWVAVSVRSDPHMGRVQEALTAFFPGFQMQDPLTDISSCVPHPTRACLPCLPWVPELEGGTDG